jgi:inosine-uridine nucleoside N-ribohydrolase
MATPVIIDTDMGIDDAAAVSLALASEALDVQAIVGVGGNVAASQVVANIGRFLKALAPPNRPVIGAGLDPAGEIPSDRRDAHGADGLGESDLAPDVPLKARGFSEVYREILDRADGEVVILALGPLTNIAAILANSPALAKGIKHIYISGGAVWARGDVKNVSEFNFHRDPIAAAAVLSSGLPITVTPLDVTCLVQLDESHVARMAASGYRTGEIIARLLRYRLNRDTPPGRGKTYIHDVVTIGGLLWPNLFLKTRMRLDVTTTGSESGRVKPALGGEASKKVDLLTAVNATDLLENVLESLCHEAFVV